MSINTLLIKPFANIVVLAFLFVLLLSKSAFSQEDFTFYNFDPVLDERCVINILNGSTRVDESGSFSLLTPLTTDIPYRARVICEQKGRLLYGESALIYADPENEEVKVGEIFFDQYHPIPISLTVTAGNTQLDIDAPVSQLQVLGQLPDGSNSNLTLGTLGTIYSASSNVVEISENGLVTALKTGQVIVSARHEGVMTSLSFDVYFPVDSDQDGMPDDFESRNALDPNDPSDAFSDKDNDGLTNIEEYLLGTSILHADTDGDTLSDFDETQSGTDPMAADTDADGLIDGEEILRGTDPLNADTDNDGVTDSIEIQFGLDPLVFTPTTNLVGRVVDINNDTVAGASVVAFNAFSSVTNQAGQFQISNVPIVNGDIIVSARIIKGGKILDGNSQPLIAIENQDASFGDIVVEEIVGQVIGTVRSPRNDLVSGARVVVTYPSGEEWSTNTNFQGVYQFTNLPEGVASVVAQDPRTGLYGVNEGTVSADSNLSLDITLRAYGTIRGKAYMQDGQTSVLESTAITISRVGGGYTTSTMSNAFGEFKFEFVPLGEYIIESIGQGKNRGRTTTVLSGTTQVHDADVIFLGLGTVNGYVEASNGQRLNDVDVRLTSSGIFATTQTQRTNNLGEFVFESVYAGDFTLSTQDEIRELSGSTKASVDRHDQQVDIVITMRPTGTITGQVLSIDSLPVVGASVISSGKSVLTDNSGNYLLTFMQVGSHKISVSTTDGDKAIVNTQINAADQIINQDIILNGLGQVMVRVVNSQGVSVPSTQVRLSVESPYRESYILNSSALGEVQFNQVLAGNFQISVFDPIARLGGSLSSTLTANESIVVTVTLEDAGDILGTVYQNDGVTPASNISVRIKPLDLIAKTGTDGRFQFNMLPLRLSPYILEAYDSSDVRRAVSQELSLTIDGEKLSQDLILKGEGAVTGLVYSPDGSLASGATVTLHSNLSGSTRKLVRTDSQGRYTIYNVPEATFLLEASIPTLKYAGNISGEIEYDGQLIILDIVMAENQFPENVQTVAHFFDGNNFSYAIQRNGSIKDGSKNVFRGDGEINRGAYVLDIIKDEEIYPFSSTGIGFEDDNREVVLTSVNGSGLAVQRKVYVSNTGYFSRYLEDFTNDSNVPITVDVRLSSHYSISSVTRSINGSTRLVRVPVGVVTSSSGDGFFNITAGQPDSWVVLDDDIDEDPFRINNLPAISHIFDGAGAELSLSNGEFLSGASGQFNRLQKTWTITVPANETISLMHFISTQTDRAAALSTAQRLVELPPEALVGLTLEEMARIKNFAVPSNGISNLAALPNVLSNISGRVFEFDEVTNIGDAKVEFQSQSPFYKRILNVQSDNNGDFSLSSKNSRYGRTKIIPEMGFNIVATHPQSLEKTNEQFPDYLADVDISFLNTGWIEGTVRRFDGVVASYGKVELISNKLDSTLVVNIPEDGQYSFRGLPNASYHLIATLPDPNGSDIGGSVDVNLSLKEHLIRDIVLTQVGGITGQVVNGAGDFEAGVEITIISDGFRRSVRTDSGGFYKFLDMPLNEYTISALDPNLGISIVKDINVIDDSLTALNFQLIKVGQASLNVLYDDGSPALDAAILIQSELLGAHFRQVGVTDSAGNKRVNNIAIGNYQIKTVNANNDTLVTIHSGSISEQDENQIVNVILAKDYAPTVNFTNPAAQSEFIKGQSITVDLDVTDDYGIYSVKFLLNGNHLATDYQAPYSTLLTLDSAVENAVITTKTLDLGGNIVVKTLGIIVREDNEDPVVSLVTPTVDLDITEGQVLAISASANDNIAVKQVEFKINGEKVYVDLNQPYEYNYPVSKNYTDTSSAITVTAEARDYNDNTSESSIAVNVIKDQLPTIEYAPGSPVAGTEYIEGTIISISATAEDDVKVARVDILGDGVLIQTRFNTPYQFSFSAPLLESIENPVSLQLKAFDSKGQESLSSILDVVIIRNELPTISWNSPIEGSEYIEGQVIPLSVNASDDVQLDRVEFFVGGTLIETISSAPFDTEYQLTSGIGGESVVIKAVAIDSMEQRNESIRTITRLDDQVAPSVEIAAPLGDAIISIGASDVVIIIDTSGSAGSSSGADLNGNGSNDTILAAEIYSAKQLLDFLNPITTRVAVVDFSSSAILVQSLTDDFALAKEKLDQILASGASGGTNFTAAMTVATNELMGIRSRAKSTPVQLFMSDGSSTLPAAQITRAADAGIIVNTFAVGQGANTSILAQIAQGTGGVDTAVPDASKIVDILPKTVLFGIDALISIAEATDDIAIKKVTLKTELLDGSATYQQVDFTAPYSLASALPEIDEALTITISAIAEDFGGNTVNSADVNVTLLPAENIPVLIKAVPEYAAAGSLVEIRGKFLIATDSEQPSTADPSQFASNQLFLNDQELPIQFADKSKITFILPDDAMSGDVYVITDSIQTNAISLFRDDDQDGLSNEQEAALGTDPSKNDSDDDGISDGQEVNEYQTNPLLADSDADGITDLVEISNQLDPNDSTDASTDNDNDGLSNFEEVGLGTGINDSDSDNDGLNDGQEVALTTNPLDYDTDNDSISDGNEVNQYSTDPLLVDTDGDTINDNIELNNGMNPLDASDAMADLDGDGLTNQEEIALGTLVNNSDSDSDDLSDFDEVNIHGTQPRNSDSDYDGEKDGLEIANGTDPLDANSSLTVAFDVVLFDADSYEWRITNTGEIRYGAYTYNRGVELYIDNTEFYDADNRALKDGTRQRVLQQTRNGLDLTRKIYVSEDHGFIRYLDIIKNNDGVSSQVVNYKLASDFYNASTQVITTSSGDAVVDINDTFAIFDDTDASGSPTASHIWGNLESAVKPLLASYSSDDFVLEYPLEVPANETVIIMHFISLSYQQSIALQNIQAYELMPDYMLDQISLEEFDGIRNFNFDTDGDGLSDKREESLGTDINNADTDGDSLTDKYEVTYGLDPLVADAVDSDTDSDGLTIAQEQALGTNPTKADTDEDGLNDGEEVTYSSDPLIQDTDGDSLLDGAEVNEYGTDPTLIDTDGDNLTDDAEILIYGTNPISGDSDSDGINDDVEINKGLNPLDAADAAADPDNDGLTTLEELNLGTYHNYADSDNDGLNDGDEVNTHGTSPTNPDTDGDGETDALEIQYGSDPLDIDSTSTMDFPVTLVDGSGYTWSIFLNGPVGQLTNSEAQDQAFTLFIDNFNEYRSEYRAKKLTDRSFEVMGRVNVEILSPVQIDREIYVPSDHAVIRYLDKFKNTTDQAIQINVMVADVFQSQVSDRITSSGDTNVTIEDRYFVSGNLNNEDKFVGHYWANPSAVVLPSDINVQGPGVGISYELDIPAQTTVSLLHFGVQANTQVDGMASLLALDSLPSYLFAGLSLDKLETVINLSLDQDNDGLIDARELELGTSIDNSDSDSDGLLDGFEVKYGFNPLLAGEEGLDNDSDTLTNLQEQSINSNPHKVDTDDDGLTDAEEMVLNTNPNLADTDKDGLTDIYERDTSLTSPINADTDGDGINDDVEINETTTDPLKADTDDDGIFDGAELAAGLNPKDSSDASLDNDSDGLTNLQEFNLQTQMNNPDTDNDGLSDGLEVNTHLTNPLLADTDSDGLMDLFEITYGFDPLVAGEDALDPDGDNLSNLDEQAKRTNPTLADTDSDGVNDDLDGAPLDPSRTSISGVILVDDSDSPESLLAYTDALDSVSIQYTVFNVAEGAQLPTREEMGEKALVIWINGVTGYLDTSEDNQLSSYLNGGGCSILSSQDHHYGRGLTPIVDTYMGLTSIDDDIAGDSSMVIRGVGTQYATEKNYSLNFDFSNYTDGLILDDGTEAMFTFGEQIVGSYYDSGTSLGVFLGYPLEAVTNVADRAEIIQKIYDQCVYTHDLSIEYVEPEIVEMEIPY